MRLRTVPVTLLLLAAVAACDAKPDPVPLPGGTGAPTAAASAPAAPQALALGTPSETVGSGGTGRLQLTPTTIAYLPAGSTLEKPQTESFAFVTVKVQAMTAVAAAQAAPISGGGWSWIAPDGQAIEQGNGAAFNVVAESFNAGGPIQPGSFVWDGQVFDLKTVQAGGTLVYVDGAGTAYRWAMPKADTGPQVEQVKKELAP
jgi:hypothetical protein